jgi:GTP-binding protein
MDFRNIAIIAHVDHGKTTLVDGMLRQCNVFSAHEAVVDRVMDSMDLERERGITITSKNTAVTYGTTKINIMDTPGHADFGGEVERVLQMVEGALLLVDAAEGPLPQTRFVLRKAMEAGLRIFVCINKIDRQDARAEEVLQEVYDLFIELDADEDQIDFPVIYACARDGLAGLKVDEEMTDLTPLMDTIIDYVPAPPGAIEGAPPQLLVTNLDSDNYVGRLGLGRLRGAMLRKNTQGVVFTEDGQKNVRIQLLYTWNGLKRVEVEEAMPGDVVAVAGIPGITVGDTLSAGENAEALPRVHVDEPTIGITIGINTSPLSGLDGKFLTARNIRERLEKELLANVSLRFEAEQGAENFRLFGRGELQLAILIEQMRREGFELSVSRPEVLYKELDDGRVLEPFEECTLDLPDDSVGPITQMMAARKGTMVDLVADGSGRSRMTYRVPSRGLIGFRNELLTETRGEGIMNTLFDSWDDKVDNMLRRKNGALVADRTGKTTAYSLFHLQPRGTLFVTSGESVYEGMIVGQNAKSNDLNVNAVRAKQLTNFRSSGADEKTVLTTPKQLTLETAMEWIDEDEWVEVTPHFLRLRKRVLATNQRSIVRR